MGPLHTYKVLAVNSFSGVGKSRGLENSFQVSENQTMRQGPCHAMEAHGGRELTFALSQRSSVGGLNFEGCFLRVLGVL